MKKTNLRETAKKLKIKLTTNGKYKTMKQLKSEIDNITLEGGNLEREERKKATTVPLPTLSNADIRHLIHLGNFEEDELDDLQFGLNIPHSIQTDYWVNILNKRDYNSMSNDLKLRHSLMFAELRRAQKFMRLKHYYNRQKYLKQKFDLNEDFW